MPSYDSKDRKGTDQDLGGRLYNSAERLINNRWTARSWSDIASSTFASTVGWAKWGVGQGLKMSINYASGGLFGALGSVAKEQGLQDLAGQVGEQAKEHIWPLIEDKIKGASEEGVVAVGGLIGKGGPAANVQKAKVEEKIENIKNAVSTLAIRAATVDKYLAAGTARYCDDVYFLAVNICEIKELKKEITKDCTFLKSFLTEVSKQVNDVKTKEMTDAVRDMARQVVMNKNIPHFNSYGFNVIGRATSCSKEHCYGKID